MKLAAVLALGMAARAAVPYLPLVGPPTLRMEPVRQVEMENVHLFEPGPAPVKTNSLPAASSTNTTAKVDAKSAANIASDVTAVAPAKNEPETSTSESGAAQFNQSLGDAFTTSVFALPTPDLLGITPEALATYFRPVRLGTNAPVVGPFPLSFIPPVPPNKSSHAEYILK